MDYSQILAAKLTEQNDSKLSDDDYYATYGKDYFALPKRIVSRASKLVSAARKNTLQIVFVQKRLSTDNA